MGLAISMRPVQSASSAPRSSTARSSAISMSPLNRGPRRCVNRGPTGHSSFEAGGSGHRRRAARSGHSTGRDRLVERRDIIRKIDATSHRFRQRNTEPAGVTPQSPVLSFGKPYLSTHHDVINTTSTAAPDLPVHQPCAAGFRGCLARMRFGSASASRSSPTTSRLASASSPTPASRPSTNSTVA